VRRSCLLVLVLATSARADSSSSVTVMLNEEGMTAARRLNVSIPELTQRAHDRIEELYKVARLDELLNAFADTGSFAQRTLGVDYDVDANDILVGLAIAGVHADIAIGTENTLLGGSIININAMTGVNLGRWAHPRWTVFANGFYETTTIRGLTGHLLTLGSHAQYQVVRGRDRGTLRWTGVALTTGLEYSRWSIGEVQGTPIESHFTAEGNAGGAVERYTIHMFSTGRLDVTSKTLTIPVEATTGVRLRRVFSLYGGGGIDVTSGSSEIVAQLDTTLTYTAERIPIGTAVIIGSGENGPSTLSAHALAGFALHTRRVRAFIQGAVAPGELSIAIGTRGSL
jgi:hypothetical protein